MTPAMVRAELLRRGLARLGQPGALWLASDAALALSWREAPDGSSRLAPPTTGDVDALARNPEGDVLPVEERADVLALLRAIATG